MSPKLGCAMFSIGAPYRVRSLGQGHLGEWNECSIGAQLVLLSDWITPGNEYSMVIMRNIVVYVFIIFLYVEFRLYSCFL